MTARLLWFAVGAGTALWWTKPFRNHSIEKTIENGVATTTRRIENPDGSYTTVSTSKAAHGGGWGHDGCHKAWRWAWAHRQPNATWEEEQTRLKLDALGRQAGDTMTEVSEAALEGLLTTVSSLKARLVEARIQREQEHRRMDELLKSSSPSSSSGSRWV